MDLEEQYDKIYRYCYFKVYHPQIAEDITQETFLRFFSRHLSFDSSRELSYLYTIARNLCIEEYRKKGRELISELDEQSSYDPTKDWIDNIVLKGMISKLPKDEQELLLLRYANEVPIAIIGKVTGLSRFAIYRKISRVLIYLKTELQKGGFSNE